MGKEPAGRHQPTPSGDVADQTVFPVQLLGEGIKQKKTPTDVRSFAERMETNRGMLARIYTHVN